MSKCDLHIHSRFSARSEEWLFRRFDFPDSYSDPRELHRHLVECGMDFVTITDHDTIDGCLEILNLPNTFISEQVTTYFPQDPCKIHLLVWGITEKQHDDIVIVRDNIFSLQRYLQGAQIAHAVAHPLYSINGKLEASHLEQLILLFKHFEGINGLRDALLSELAQQLFGSLTPEKIEELAKKHNLTPTHEQAWKKIFVGGSDDHGGQFIATAYTETPRADSTDKFLEHIRAGKCQAHGHGGTPLALSHGFYNTVACFIQDHFHEKLGPSAALVEQMFSRFMEGRDPTEFTLAEKASLFGQAVRSGKIFELFKPANVSLGKFLPERNIGRLEELENLTGPHGLPKQTRFLCEREFGRVPAFHEPGEHLFNQSRTWSQLLVEVVLNKTGDSVIKSVRKGEGSSAVAMRLALARANVLEKFVR